MRDTLRIAYLYSQLSDANFDTLKGHYDRYLASKEIVRQDLPERYRQLFGLSRVASEDPRRRQLPNNEPNNSSRVVDQEENAEPKVARVEAAKQAELKRVADERRQQEANAN